MKLWRLILPILVLFLVALPLRAETIFFYDLGPEALEAVNLYRAEISSSPCTMKALRWSPELAAAAEDFLRQAVATLSFDHYLPDGSSPRTRLEAQGYQPAFVGESLAYLAFENFLPPEEALSVVLSWFFDQAKAGEPEATPFLFPAYEDFALAMAGVQLELEGKTYNLYLFCFLFAVPEEAPAAEGLILGRFFDDQDEDTRPRPKEGLTGAEVLFFDFSGQLEAATTTFADGSFCLPANGPGLLKIRLGAETELYGPRLELFSPFSIFVEAPSPRLWSNLASVGQN